MVPLQKLCVSYGNFVRKCYQWQYRLRAGGVESGSLWQGCDVACCNSPHSAVCLPSLAPKQWVSASKLWGCGISLKESGICTVCPATSLFMQRICYISDRVAANRASCRSYSDLCSSQHVGTCMFRTGIMHNVKSYISLTISPPSLEAVQDGE